MTTIVSGSSITFNDNTTQNTSAYGGGFAMRNRIINGDMRIDQRNAGASVTAGSTYPVDRFSSYRSGGTGAYTAQQSSVAPAGFRNSIIATVTSTGTSNEASIYQVVEGFNVADLNLGTANAVTFTLSFWVRSSVTGTYSLSFRASGGTRSYVTTYTINSANTWEQKTITVAGDTTGTWNTTNGAGLIIDWSLGQANLTTSTLNAWQGSNLVFATGSTNLLATNGATFYITGVQLEKGSTATSFDYRPYGQELALCQRYYYRFNPTSSSSNTLGSGFVQDSTNAQILHFFPVSMRTSPTALEQSGTAGNYAIRATGGVTTCSTVPTFGDANTNTSQVLLTVASGLTGGQAILARAVNTSAWLAWSAEL